MSIISQVIVSWNGMAISAFARASKILKNEHEGIQFHFPVVGANVSFRTANFKYVSCEFCNNDFLCFLD